MKSMAPFISSFIDFLQSIDAFIIFVFTPSVCVHVINCSKHMRDKEK